jgi:hypothetical protein
MPTQSTGQWTLQSQNGLDSLQYDVYGTKSEQSLGPDEVLVELRAASLNYRDLVLTKVCHELILIIACVYTLILNRLGHGWQSDATPDPPVADPGLRRLWPDPSHRVYRGFLAAGSEAGS